MSDALPEHRPTDPRELRALAHPLRMRLMEELALDGPATATELSAKVNESPANCSWHLRQLARYGHVEETGEGKGRNRPWRLVVRSLRFGGSDDAPEVAQITDALGDLHLEREYAQLRAWEAARRTETPEWQDASFLNLSMAWLTAAELAALDEELLAIALRHADRLSDPSRRPEGARPISLVAWGVPKRPATPQA
jgi:DNA-binding transcriptional ArsR family regulator